MHESIVSHYLHHKSGEELESIPIVQHAASKLARDIAAEKPSVTDITLMFCGPKY